MKTKYLLILFILAFNGCAIWKSPATKGILWDDCEKYTFSNIKIVPNHKEKK